MGKKSKKHEPKLSKKEQRKLEEKAAKKAAERKAAEKAERKAAEKKAAKKAKKGAATAPEQAAEAPAAEEPKHPHLQHLDRVGELSAIVQDDTAKKSARKAAQAELDQLRAEGEARIAAADQKKAREQTADEIDAEIKARLEKKRAERSEPKNKTSLDALQAQVAHDRERRHGRGEDRELVVAGVTTDAGAAADEAIAETKKSKTKSVEVDGTKVAETTSVDIADEKPKHDFGMPSASLAERPDYDTNGNGQYVVKRPADGKEVGYTRVTTYIDALEDKTMLTKWKMRMLLEGVAVGDEQAATGERSESPTAKIRDLAHRRDVAIAKARKADRKGKLVPGQLATITEGAWGDFKRAMDALADDLFEVGGGREKAAKGTDIHELCDIHDRDGMQAIDAMLEAGTITPSDHADVTAYARAIRALGAKITASELTVVDHEKKVAGRLDRVLLLKLPEIRDPKTDEVIYPGDTRARRYVADIKTGRVDLGAGKIAQQIRQYAESEAYDLETQETSSHGANRSYGLLIHVPAGTGTATVHLVDLNAGAAGNKIVADVRAFRNSGKRAITLSVDLAAEKPAAE